MASTFGLLVDENHDEFSTLYWLLLDFSLTVKAAPHECVIRTNQP